MKPEFHPPIVLVFALILIRLVANYDSIIVLPYALAVAIATLLLILGICISAAGVLSFKQADTTVNPLDPGSASNLVTDGIYRYTRNPMYLGMLAVAIAVTVYFSSVMGLMVVAGFYLFMSRFQIEPEERAMKDLFGDEFKQYKQKVRRWI